MISHHPYRLFLDPRQGVTGLACGEPSILAWQAQVRAAHTFMAVPDAAAVEAMRRLAAM